jgi:hypothetical protein
VHLADLTKAVAAAAAQEKLAKLRRIVLVVQEETAGTERNIRFWRLQLIMQGEAAAQQETLQRQDLVVQVWVVWVAAELVAAPTGLLSLANRILAEEEAVRK